MYRSMISLPAISLSVVMLASSASAQVSAPKKATAMEKMMPSAQVPKMRDCQKQAKLQKVQTEDRSKFIKDCMSK